MTKWLLIAGGVYVAYVLYYNYSLTSGVTINGSSQKIGSSGWYFPPFTHP